MNVEPRTSNLSTSLEEQLQSVKNQAPNDFATASDAESLEAVRIKYLGRQGVLPELMKQLGAVLPQDRGRIGKIANETKIVVQSSFEARVQQLKESQESASVAEFDYTLPGRRRSLGRIHPVIQTMERVVSIFNRLGFTVAEGPEVEDEWHCFDALNTPADHPARDLQDTLYLKDGRLLRTHTSTVQIRVMESHQPPIRIVAPGRAFRRDECDATHSACFTQIEGLYVDENVSVADLKGVIEYLFHDLLGTEARTRLRPHFFPFTEPSFEFDLSAAALGIKGKEWLEIGGCGMVDPNVFKAVGYDPERYTGFAFGFGIERIAMILHGINDIRLFYENDLRFLRQF